jgi:hypothetical protein
MAASTSTAVDFAVSQDVSRVRAVVDRNTKEVKDYTSQYEDQYKLVEALDTDRNKPENKSVLDILTLRDSRLNATLIRESAAIAILANFHVTDKAVIQALATVAAASFVVLPTPATTTSPTITIDKKIMKRKLPKPRDNWKDASGKTHKVQLGAITIHKTVSILLWQMMDIVHVQSGGDSTPTLDLLLARLIPYATIEENITSYTVLGDTTDDAKLRSRGSAFRLY